MANTVQDSQDVAHAATRCFFTAHSFAEVDILLVFLPHIYIRRASRSESYPQLTFHPIYPTMAITSSANPPSDISQSHYAKRTRDLIGLITDLRALGYAFIMLVLSSP